MSVRYINPEGLYAAPYSHVVATSGGTTVYISGQVATNAAGETVGDTLEAQIEQVFANLKMALQAAGADIENLVKINTFVVGLDADSTAVFRKVRNAYFGSHRPASTLVDTRALVNPEYLVEIEGIAVID